MIGEMLLALLLAKLGQACLYQALVRYEMRPGRQDGNHLTRALWWLA